MTVGDRRWGALPEWSCAFEFAGVPFTVCVACNDPVDAGQLATVEVATRAVWHDYCAMRHITILATLEAASASPDHGDRRSVVGGADGAAGAGRASAVPCRPAAPIS